MCWRRWIAKHLSLKVQGNEPNTKNMKIHGTSLRRIPFKPPSAIFALAPSHQNPIIFVFHSSISMYCTALSSDSNRPSPVPLLRCQGRFGSHLLGLLVGCSYGVLWVSCPLERVMGSGSQELNWLFLMNNWLASHCRLLSLGSLQLWKRHPSQEVPYKLHMGKLAILNCVAQIAKMRGTYILHKYVYTYTSTWTTATWQVHVYLSLIFQLLKIPR